MVELLFVVCLAGASSECSERSLLFTDITPQRCLMGAQPELAKWSVQHPNYQIKSWMCRDVSVAAKEV
jgi:hypothetical protein